MSPITTQDVAVLRERISESRREEIRDRIDRALMGPYGPREDMSPKNYIKAHLECVTDVAVAILAEAEVNLALRRVPDTNDPGVRRSFIDRLFRRT